MRFAARRDVLTEGLQASRRPRRWRRSASGSASGPLLGIEAPRSGGCRGGGGWSCHLRDERGADVRLRWRTVSPRPWLPTCWARTRGALPAGTAARRWRACSRSRALRGLAALAAAGRPIELVDLYRRRPGFGGARRERPRCRCGCWSASASDGRPCGSSRARALRAGPSFRLGGRAAARGRAGPRARADSARRAAGAASGRRSGPRRPPFVLGRAGRGARAEAQRRRGRRGGRAAGDGGSGTGGSLACGRGDALALPGGWGRTMDDRRAAAGTRGREERDDDRGQRSHGGERRRGGGRRDRRSSDRGERGGGALSADGRRAGRARGRSGRRTRGAPAGSVGLLANGVPIARGRLIDLEGERAVEVTELRAGPATRPDQ